MAAVSCHDTGNNRQNENVQKDVKPVEAKPLHVLLYHILRIGLSKEPVKHCFLTPVAAQNTTPRRLAARLQSSSAAQRLYSQQLEFGSGSHVRAARRKSLRSRG